jgi:probable rRNA maturation factor
MSVTVDVQYGAKTEGLPERAQIRTWVRAALRGRRAAAELTVRIVDEAEGTALNTRYRGRGGPTNVLSFPFEGIPGVDLPLLGDIVICAPVVRREAAEQGKPEPAHWAHVVVHGALHLLGHDHIDAEEARAMEAMERQILAGLGYPDPYRDEVAS